MLHALSALLAFVPATVAAATAAPATVAPDRAVAFVSSPREASGRESELALPLAPFEVRAGDALAYRLRLAEPAPAAAGLELWFDDGRALSAPTHAATSAWIDVRIELSAHAGTRAQTLAIAARGARGPAAFLVADARIERSDGAFALIDDALGFGAYLARDLDLGAAAMLVPASSEPDAGGVRAPFGVGEPWIAFDLTALRAREPAPPLAERTPRGLSWSGPGVPLRFANAGVEVAGFPARGQLLGLQPLDGGRYYEVWLALACRTGEELSTSAHFVDLRRTRHAVPLRVRARAERSTAWELCEIAIAASEGLVSFELPSDERLVVLAASARWRPDGPTDAHFRARCIEQAGEAGPNTNAHDAIARWSENRRAGLCFGSGPQAEERERALFDALQRGDAALFGTLLDAELEVQRQRGQRRKQLSIELLATLPTENLDLVRALAALPPNEPASVLGALPSDVERLAREDPRALAQLVQRVNSGTWQPFGAPWLTGAAARLGPHGLVRLVAQGQRALARHLGAPSRVALFDGDPGRLRNLPALYASAGIDTILHGTLANASSGERRSTAATWSRGASAIAVVSPEVELDGPLRFDERAWSRWKRWMGAGSAEPLRIACDVSAAHANGALSLARAWQSSLLAPSVRWVSIDDLARSSGGRATIEPGAPVPLARDDAAVELAARASVRAAELALARSLALESLAESDGAIADERPAGLARWLFDATAGEPQKVAAAGRTIARRASKIAGKRLGELAPAHPGPGAGVPLVVLDSQPWPRRVQIELADAALRAYDAQGRELPSQASAGGGVLLELELDGLAARGLRVREAKDSDAAGAERVRPAHGAVRVNGLRLINGSIAVELDPATRALKQVWALPQRTALLAGAGEVLDLASAFGTERLGAPQEFTVVESGPLRAVVRCEWITERARVTRELALHAGQNWVEIRTRVEPLGAPCELLARLAFEHAHANALAQVPFGATTLAPDDAGRRPLDLWLAASDGTATTALLGDASVAAAWTGRRALVALPADGEWHSYALLGSGRGWRRAALDEAALERLQDPLVRALEIELPAPRERKPLVEIARVERGGSHRAGREAGVALLALEPGERGTIDLVLAEQHDQDARVELAFERPPFEVALVDLAGRVLEILRVDERRVEFALPAGAVQAVRVRVRP